MLFNRDLNLLVRINEMRNEQLHRIEDRFIKIRKEKVTKEDCLASQRRIEHLRKVFKGEGGDM